MVTIDKFLGTFSKRDTIDGYRVSLKQFFDVVGIPPSEYFGNGRRYENDVVAFKKHLEDTGKSSKTIQCRLGAVRSYLLENDVELKRRFWKRLHIIGEPATKDRLFNHLIFWKVDRLGRNAIHTQTIAEELNKLGITFTITSLNIDTSTASGKFIFGIMAQYAEMERAMTIERVNLMYSRLRKDIEDQGFYINKKGKKRTTFGRPKGKKDEHPRRKSGYYLRWGKKVTPQKLKGIVSDDLTGK